MARASTAIAGRPGVAETAALRDGARHVVVNGIRHWCRVDGAGRADIPVIAVHGGPGGNHYVFERTVVPRLSEAVAVVCYEQRGCGRSDPPPSPGDYSLPLLVSDLDELRAALALEHVMLLGYSFGADLAIEYALAHPTRVTRMILQAPHATTGLPEAAEVQLRGFAEVTSKDVEEAVEAIMRRDDSPETKLAAVWRCVDTATVDAFLFHSAAAARRNRGLWRESGLINTGAMANALDRQAGTQTPLRYRLADLRTPSLVLVGRYDRNVGVTQASEVAQLLPNARLHVFERSAHFPDLEEPEEYLSVVVPFLTTPQRGMAAR